MSESPPHPFPLPLGGGEGARRAGEGDAPRIRYFGDYELLEEIARGGMGVVYKARQVSLNRTVAVKMILAGQLAAAADVQRFRHEAESAASLQHPNIVAIHEVGEHEGQHYFSMDYVEGRDLTGLVRDGPLPPKRAASYLKTIAEAIHYAHQKGVLHRDLKPSNVLIDQNEQPRVTDFGLAKRLTDSEPGTPNPELTLSGQILGTPNYMPPEQARGRRGEIGPASDVYSLGGILFFLLTGRPPFVGETLEETLSQVLHAEPVSLRLLAPGTPRDLETITLKCLEKAPSMRFSTAQDLADELGRFLREEPIHARPIGPVEKMWRWCLRKPVVASIAGGTVFLLVAMLAGSLIAWWRIEHLKKLNRVAEARADFIRGPDPEVRPKIRMQTLSSGLRVVLVHFPGSTNVSLFTFLSVGLASDPPQHAQWSHLLEHLAVRSTLPEDVRQANGETSPDHLRLDFYGHLGNWKEGLSHHKRWLEGVPFTEATLLAEKPKVIAECDFTAKNLSSHKFALVAWAQGQRHGHTRVELKGDVQRAALPDVQRYRDERLVVPAATTLCLVGGVDAEAFFAEAERQLGRLQSRATLAAPVQARPGNLELTWDLDARHLVLAWPIPDFRQDDYAALMAAARWLNVQFYSDARLKELTGHILAETDLATPEGNFFYVSASLRPGAEFAEVQKTIQAQVNHLNAAGTDLQLIPMLGRRLGFSFTEVQDPDSYLAQAGPDTTRAQAEGTIGLQLGMSVHRYGPRREALAKTLAEVSPSRVRQVAAKYLTETNGSVTWIRSVSATPAK